MLARIELKFQYTQSEYVRAERQYLIAAKILHKYDPVLAVLCLLIAMIYMLASAFSTLSVILFGIVILVVIMGCCLYFLMPILKYKNTSKFHEAYTLIFSEDAIYFKTDSIDSELQWNVYSQLWHNDNFYYLIQGVRMYTLIPKRVFKDSDEQEAFEELVQSKLKLIKRI